MTSIKTHDQTVLGNVHDQPEMLREAFARRSEIIEPFVRSFTSAPVKRVVFLGSGTSYNVSNIAAAYFTRLVGVEGVAPYPTEFMNYGVGLDPQHNDPQSVLVVGISQSGTSISTCEAMEWAKNQGYRTFAITSDVTSKITEIVTDVAPLLVGQELTGPETKGYTASILSIYLWAYSAAGAVGSLSENEVEAALQAAGTVCNDFDRVIAESEAWYDRNRPGLLHSSRINVLGYGIDYGTMLEGTLKIAEMLRVPTIGNLLEEHGHGPTYALKFDHATLIVGSEEKEFERALEFRRALPEYAPGTHVITCQDFDDADERDLVFSTKAGTYLAPLLYSVPMQFLSAKGGEDVYIDTDHNPVDIHLGHYEAERQSGN
ncbi:SIS domain-containing protein [Leucobacter sp. USHLN154]|uniref:SIS domain-containing protein n=1 Tax=Leucobacter sp. USHLN154 TaxID=3081269 RepID=UPI003018477E